MENDLSKESNFFSGMDIAKETEGPLWTSFLLKEVEKGRWLESKMTRITYFKIATLDPQINFKSAAVQSEIGILADVIAKTFSMWGCGSGGLSFFLPSLFHGAGDWIQSLLNVQ